MTASSAVSMPSTGPNAPALFLPEPKTAERFWEFFAANIRNPNTRRAYYQAARRFSQWCTARGLNELACVRPLHVAAYVETLQQEYAKPTAKQHLAALRALFDWLVVGQAIPSNPAHAVRGPRHSARTGRTPVLTAEETRTLLDSIDPTTPAGLRDRALIALMVYTFARVGAVVAMRVEDYFIQGRRGWVRLNEKGGKRHQVPAHHNLDAYLEAYLTGTGLLKDSRGPLFRTLEHTAAGGLSTRPMRQSDVYRMIVRRAAAAGIATRIGCHTFRATGITTYLKNGGRLEIAQQIAAHSSPRTTGLYDRRGDDVSLDEVERIAI